MEDMVWHCSGDPLTGPKGGWRGHVLPGTLFVLWATHWLLGAYRSYFESKRAGQQFQCSACYRMLWFPRHWPLEQWCKVILPFLGVIAEVSTIGHDHYRNLLCYADDKRAGHINDDTLNNWQHSVMYLCFVVSGLVDLLCWYSSIPLPRGIDQAFLSLAFFGEALLMGLHDKHEPLDKIMHLVLFYSMMATAVSALMELAYPNSFLAACARVATTFWQGTWFFASARVMFEGRPAWDRSQDDYAPVLMAPVLFISQFVCIVFGMGIIFIITAAIYRYIDSRTATKPI